MQTSKRIAAMREVLHRAIEFPDDGEPLDTDLVAERLLDMGVMLPEECKKCQDRRT